MCGCLSGWPHRKAAKEQLAGMWIQSSHGLTLNSTLGLHLLLSPITLSLADGTVIWSVFHKRSSHRPGMLALPGVVLRRKGSRCAVSESGNAMFSGASLSETRLDREGHAVRMKNSLPTLYTHLATLQDVWIQLQLDISNLLKGSPFYSAPSQTPRSLLYPLSLSLPPNIANCHLS